jgi:hypothetical protein
MRSSACDDGFPCLHHQQQLLLPITTHPIVIMLKEQHHAKQQALGRCVVCEITPKPSSSHRISSAWLDQSLAPTLKESKKTLRQRLLLLLLPRTAVAAACLQRSVFLEVAVLLL